MHSSLLEIFLAVMEFSKEQMPEMSYCEKYIIRKGIGGRDRRTCDRSELLCDLNCIPANHITLQFFHPLYTRCFIKHTGFHTYEGEMLHHCFCQQSSFFSSANNVNQCCEKQGWGEISWDKYQFSNMKGNIKKPKSSLSRRWICFFIFLSYLCTSHWCATYFWMLAFNNYFYKLWILYLKFIYSMKQ